MNDEIEEGLARDIDITQNPGGYTLGIGAPKTPTREELERLLMYVPIEEACRIKDGWGREEHRPNGEEEFQGDRLVNLHCEGLDANNYIRYLMERYGHLKEMHECLEQGMIYANGIIAMARMMAQILGGGEEEAPQAKQKPK